MLGVSSPTVMASKSSDVSLTIATELQDVPDSIPKHCHITLTPVQSADFPMPSTSSTSSVPSSKSILYPVIVVPELAIPTETYPEHLNQPGGSKDYVCQLCTFLVYLSTLKP